MLHPRLASEAIWRLQRPTSFAQLPSALASSMAVWWHCPWRLIFSYLLEMGSVYGKPSLTQAPTNAFHRFRLGWLDFLAWG
jgi:hypothetical protein